MQIILLQLSDIHIKTNSDVVLSRAAKIKDACHAAAPNAAGCVIILSGDIAYSGLKTEYEDAYRFLVELKEQLLGLPAMSTVVFIAVPGNHDCNFEKESDVRQFLLSDLEKLIEMGVTPDSDLVKTILAVQQNFFSFEARLTDGRQVGAAERLSFARLVEFGDFKMRFQCYNTAWLSRQKDLQSQLYLPEATIEPVSTDASLSVSVFHHPYNWLNSHNYRILKDAVEQTCDLVFTGHEHVGGGGTFDRFSGEHLQYVEGVALQGENGPSDSGFTIVSIDTQTGAQRLEQFRWKSAGYEQCLQKEWSSTVRNPSRLHQQFKLNSDFLSYLTQPGAAFTHKRRRNLQLADIYVYPDLTQWSAQKLVAGGKDQKIIGSRAVLEHFKSVTNAVVTGPDDSGKTALLRTLFLDMSAEYVPLLVSGAEFAGKFSESKFNEIIAAAVRRQYSGEVITKFMQLDPKVRVLLFDDFHKTDLNPNNQLRLMECIRNMFGQVFVAAADVFRVATLTRKGSELDPLKGFEICEIREFGHRLRAQLINKWLSIGRESASDVDTIEYESRATERIITGLLGKNVVPATPFNILTLMQTIEAVQPHATTGSSYGALHEVLIKTRLQMSASDEADETGIKFNYISLIAYAIFKADRGSITESELSKVNKLYAEKFTYSANFSRIISDLIAAQIIESVDGCYSFKDKHFYYYFVAKYFERALRRRDEHAAELRQQLRYIADRLHNEELANIVVFYLYLTQDWDLTKHIMDNARRIYADNEPCDFEKHVEFVNKIFTSAPKMIVDDGNVEEHQDKYRQQLDEQDDKDTEQSLSLDAKVTYSDSLTDIHKLNIAFKTLQVLGQVLRGSADSLEGDIKLEITKTCYMLGLRSLRALLSIAENNLEQFRLYLSLLIKERAAIDNVELSERDLLNKTDEALVWLTQMCAYGTVRKISYATGHHHLSETYEQLMEENQESTAVSFINLSTKLDGHTRGIPEAEIASLRERVSDNSFSWTLLRRMIADFLYLNRIDIRTRQKLGKIFEIEGVTSAAFMLPDKKKN
jgi:predicted MPP superfamily phosphohydrolase